MSLDRGRQLVRQTSPRPTTWSNLARPSLFADVDSAMNVLDSETQRVPILSTLESARRRTRVAPFNRHLPFKLPENWQIKVLVGLMAIGLLALLVAFAMMVLSDHRLSEQVDATVAVRTFKPGINIAPSERHNPLAALMTVPLKAASPATRAPAPEPSVAVIESSESPPAQTITRSKPALHVVLAAQSKYPAMLAASASKSSTTRSIDAAAYAVMTSSKPVNSPVAKRVEPIARKDADVALLEAMFAHTGSRTSAPAMSAAEEIKTRCNVLSGAPAAICRAKVCVQNPSAPVCHQDP